MEKTMPEHVRNHPVSTKRRWPGKAFWIGFCAGIAALILGLFLLERAIIKNDRLRRNETVVIAALKRYHAAQTIFSQRDYAGIAGNTSVGLGANAYADNFRNLCYGVDENGKAIWLISGGIADAFLVDNALGGAKTGRGASAESSPYSGYYFMEDIFGLPAARYDAEFACMAFPAVYGETGWHVFWIGTKGDIYMHDPKAASGTAARELCKLYYAPTPRAPNPVLRWRAQHGR